MKILHLPNSFLPWSTGGTETYALGLAKSLRKNGVESFFCIHTKDPINIPAGNYTYAGFSIKVLNQIPDEGERINIYTRRYSSLPGFLDYIQELKPDLIHFHDLGGGASISHLLLIKEFGYKTILTYHSPGISCLQRALLFKNSKICDGRLDISRCSNCLISTKGLPFGIGSMIQVLGTHLPIKNSDSTIWRLATVPSATRIFIENFKLAIQKFDKIHVHAEWVADLFRINELPEEKLFFARTAGPVSLPEFKKSTKILSDFTFQKPLKMAFLGRCDYVKGVHILVDAIKLLPFNTPISIQFIGPYWDSKYGKGIWESIKNDSRFQAPLFIAPELVLETIKEFDLLVIPSLWPETGPLSLLEGLAAGVPILGSDSGGISEWIEDNQNGFLFKTGDPISLRDKIEWILANPTFLNSIRKKSILNRTMDDLASEIYKLYSEISANQL